MDVFEMDDQVGATLRSLLRWTPPAAASAPPTPASSSSATASASSSPPASPSGVSTGSATPTAADATDRAFREQFPRLTFVDEGEELIPDGARVEVTARSRLAFVRMVIARRRRLVLPAAEAMRRGMANIIPDRGIALCSDRDLRVLVCGPDQIDIEVLKRHTQYGRPFALGHPVVTAFWTVMERMSHRERQMVIRFAWGRNKLPPTEDAWAGTVFRFDPFYLAGPRGLVERKDESLFEAHTCFFQLKVPFFSSAEVLRRKLILCINEGAGEFAIA